MGEETTAVFCLRKNISSGAFACARRSICARLSGSSSRTVTPRSRGGVDAFPARAKQRVIATRRHTIGQALFFGSGWRKRHVLGFPFFPDLRRRHHPVNDFVTSGAGNAKPRLRGGY